MGESRVSELELQLKRAKEALAAQKNTAESTSELERNIQVLEMENKQWRTQIEDLKVQLEQQRELRQRHEVTIARLEQISLRFSSFEAQECELHRQHEQRLASQEEVALRSSELAAQDAQRRLRNSEHQALEAIKISEAAEQRV